MYRKVKYIICVQLLFSILPAQRDFNEELKSQEKSIESLKREMANLKNKIKEMANRGIGRPSTYHSIISGIQRRDYVNQKKRKLMPSFVAVSVTQLLENHFEPLVNIDFSANLEDRLDQISRGELNLLPFMNDFYFGDSKIKGLEKMLEEEIDIRKACSMPIPSSNGKEFIARFISVVIFCIFNFKNCIIRIKFYFNADEILSIAKRIFSSDAAYEILIQFPFPNASPVTVATCAFSKRYRAKSVAFLIFLPFLCLVF